ncbi:MAG: hypothetical protein ABIC40_03640, partial [bacterium]
MVIKRILKRLPVVLFISVLMSFSLSDKVSSQTQPNSIVERTRELMKTVSELRGLPFLNELPVNLVSSEKITEVIRLELDEEIPEDLNRTFSDLYVMMGLMKHGRDLRSAYEKMIGEQAAGLYDPQNKEFYVVDIDTGKMVDDMLSDFGPLGGLVQGFLGGMDFDMTDMVIVHELTHALDDQHFDFNATLEKLRDSDSDDKTLAYQSLLEGNATRVTNDYMAKILGVDYSMMSGFTDMYSSMAEGMMDYDPMLEKLMIAPYMKGEQFVRYVYKNKGQDGLDNAFIDIPESMEQVLHPDLYYPNRDNPSKVGEPDLSTVLKDWSKEGVDTMGEFIIKVMFELLTMKTPYAEDIARGWDGDRVTLWRSPKGDLAFCWVSVWDTNKDAEDFYNAYRDLMKIKYPEGVWKDTSERYSLYTGESLASILDHYGQIVVIAEGVP